MGPSMPLDISETGGHPVNDEDRKHRVKSLIRSVIDHGLFIRELESVLQRAEREDWPGIAAAAREVLEDERRTHAALLRALRREANGEGRDSSCR